MTQIEDEKLEQKLNSRWRRYGKIFLLGVIFPFSWNYFKEHYSKIPYKKSIRANTPPIVKPNEKSSEENLHDWYLWLNLTTQEDRDAFVKNHIELRKTFNLLGKKYPHLQMHDGNFDKLPDCVLVFTTRSVRSSRYCMAKIPEQYKPEIDCLREDLASESLEERIIGPTNNPKDILKYGDNFKLQKLLDC